MNQDLFIERRFSSSNTQLVSPGVRNIFYGQLKKDSPLEDNDFIALPREAEVDSNKDTWFRNKFCYVKLHGSWNWLSSDGSSMLVIGQDKEEQISREPLLKLYFAKFKQVLSVRETRLLVIGYGFRDKHVNGVIANSMQNNDIKLLVITRAEPKKFFEELEKSPEGKLILEKGSNLYPFNHTLTEIFTSRQDVLDRIKSLLFT